MANRNRKISQVVARTQAAQGRDARLQQHEGSPNNTHRSQMFPGLGKRLGGPLKPAKPLKPRP